MLRQITDFTLRLVAGANAATIILMLCVGYSDRIYPSAHGYAGVAGLAFPLVLAVNLALLAFWLCVFSAVLVGGITLAMGEFVWPSTAFTRGALALYCCVSTAASLLFQLGNRFIGAQSASMLSTFEPLTSVVIGILVYHEVLTVRLGIGIFCILLAVFLLAKADGTVKEETKSEA